MSSLLLLFMGMLPLACASDDDLSQFTLAGTVTSGEEPIADSQVTLFGTDPDGRGLADVLGSATTDADGRFDISYAPPSDSERVLYVVATDGELSGAAVSTFPNTFVLASVLGTVAAADVVVNERTTVASGFALAQFLDDGNVAGPSPGLQNAAVMVQNLVDVTTGGIAGTLATSPNGSDTSTLSAFNSLANMLHACATDVDNCAALLADATPPGGSAPQTTFQAMADIAANPANNVASLYDLSVADDDPPYQPFLDEAPTAWTLALKFWGNGEVFSGPGEVAFDALGRVWANNNYMYSADPDEPTCASDLLFRLDMTRPGGILDIFTGGGLDGAGFGITIDPVEDVWVGNFGFAGQGCTVVPSSNSVSKFTLDGEPLSPSDGFAEGNLSWPQATVSDQSGNVWIANCGNGSVTIYYNGDPDEYANLVDEQIGRPFGIAIDAGGVAWVTGNRSDNVFAYRADGSQLSGSPFGGLDKPMGIAVDSAGHKWVSNSHIIVVPCDANAPPYDLNLQQDGSIALLLRDGSQAANSPFRGGGLTIPWGIAVDGKSNVWVANFGGRRLSHFCGADTSNCPPGLETGDPISPDTGYFFDGLQRNTGVGIDASGNVWLTNNWKNDVNLANPGGDGLVVYIGLAGPVRMPMIGPPQPPE